MQPLFRCIIKLLILVPQDVYKRQVLDDETIEKAFDFCNSYKKFLDDSKTEREAVQTTVNLL